MVTNEWTVRELMDALKRFPLEAKVYYEMAQMDQEQSGKRSMSRSVVTTRWECCWRNSRVSPTSRNEVQRSLQHHQDRFEHQLVQQGSHWMIHLHSLSYD